MCRFPHYLFPNHGANSRNMYIDLESPKVHDRIRTLTPAQRVLIHWAAIALKFQQVCSLKCCKVYQHQAHSPRGSKTITSVATNSVIFTAFNVFWSLFHINLLQPVLFQAPFHTLQQESPEVSAPPSNTASGSSASCVRLLWTLLRTPSQSGASVGEHEHSDCLSKGFLPIL